MKLTHHPRSALVGRIAEYQTVHTPFGKALIAITGPALCWLCFPQKGDGVEMLRDYWKGGLVHPSPDDLQPLADRLFGGRHAEIEVFVAGTDFQHSVWRELAAIGHGETVSYGELARRIGRPLASRPVGGAVGANPVAWLLPCHRVLGSTGALHGFACGLEMKAKFLKAEGIMAAA